MSTTNISNNVNDLNNRITDDFVDNLVGDHKVYSMTDAMLFCMKQPGVVAVAFVELKTGKAVAGAGIENLDVDLWTPLLAKMLIACYPNDEFIRDDYASSGYQNSPGSERFKFGTRPNLPELTITMKSVVHFVYPLSQEGIGMYFYVALNPSLGSPALIRRRLIQVDDNLRL